MPSELLEMSAVQHTPVLLKTAIDLLRVQPGGIYADCTVGLGGHASEILMRLKGRGELIGLDRDGSALELARERLLGISPHFQLFHENFKNLTLICRGLEIAQLDGCLLDLGVSSLQLDSPKRGFSFRHDADLDMRMDQRSKISAAHLLSQLSRERLEKVFRDYGEERHARKIAEEIVRRRRVRPIRSTHELARLVESIKGRPQRGRIHPATQVFQALRIEVNQELAGLDTSLEEIISLLKPGGRLVVIAFHSLEDRLVKQTFRLLRGQCICFRPAPVCRCPRVQKVNVITRRPICPDEEELAVNPRARSARLRAVEKCVANDKAEEGSDEQDPQHTSNQFQGE